MRAFKKPACWCFLPICKLMHSFIEIWQMPDLKNRIADLITLAAINERIQMMGPQLN